MSDASTSAEELIARCAAGDGRALEALYRQTSAQLFGLLRRILDRDDLAQEALQDVYVSVWRNAERYSRTRGAAFTWLVSIARYRAIDIVRSRKHEIPSGTARDIEERRSDGSVELDLSSVVDQDAEARRLNECLQRLEPDQRSAIGMAYLRGLESLKVCLES